MYKTQYITESFWGMNVGFAKVSPKMQIVINNALLCERIKHNS
ncbi:hypothetical protein PAND9192_02061 [Photobacterium andalusiense]|uniref:Uncharacterized protein n=1 Tax=Photobacterium andalusiense TaxID=2204296 RepID=A0A1Y6MHV5_9GAMM|nr:hypothetical protein PAND9192_02061 [Photobacterium andalusiense]